MVILGISSYYHDSAAAIIKDGEILAAAQEERYTRKRHDANFPKNAILSCLSTAKILPTEIDNIVFYDKPLLKFERLLESYFASSPKGFLSFKLAMPIWLREKLFLRDLLLKELKRTGFGHLKGSNILFSEHHLSHAASAFYPSPFAEAAILTMDGVGEWATTSIGKGTNNQIELMQELHFPHSLGLLYSAFTFYCGFTVNSGEYKLMGLAPYGEPIFTDIILKEIIDLRPDGSFRLNMEYFDYVSGLKMINQKFCNLFGQKARESESELTQFYKNIAASIQKVTEIVVEKLALQALKITGSNNLCLSGGVALNCVANGKVLQNNPSVNLWIQPASGDAGGALGAALAYYYAGGHNQREITEPDGMNYAFLGPEFSDVEIVTVLDNNNAVYQTLNDSDKYLKTATLLANGKCIGWFQGRMEFGPRALGNRSILADPRSNSMQKDLNLKIKFRESFRPFAPAIKEENAKEYFSNSLESPYMLLTFNANSKNELEATTHVDGTSRVQTVSAKTNSQFYALIDAFSNITHCPALVNTSFNIRGEPLVCSPDNAYQCFMSTGLDALVIGNYLLLKEEQPVKNLRKPKPGID